LGADCRDAVWLEKTCGWNRKISCFCAVEALTKASRAAMLKAHPDYGGTNAEARTVLEAYAVLKQKYRSN
jgi:hypothetical protein